MVETPVQLIKKAGKKLLKGSGVRESTLVYLALELKVLLGDVAQQAAI